MSEEYIGSELHRLALAQQAALTAMAAKEALFDELLPAIEDFIAYTVPTINWRLEDEYLAARNKLRDVLERAKELAGENNTASGDER